MARRPAGQILSSLPSLLQQPRTPLGHQPAPAPRPPPYSNLEAAANAACKDLARNHSCRLRTRRHRSSRPPSTSFNPAGSGTAGQPPPRVPPVNPNLARPGTKTPLATSPRLARGVESVYTAQLQLPLRCRAERQPPPASRADARGAGGYFPGPVTDIAILCSTNKARAGGRGRKVGRGGSSSPPPVPCPRQHQLWLQQHLETSAAGQCPASLLRDPPSGLSSGGI